MNKFVGSLAQSIVKVLFLTACVCTFSFSVKAQACGYSHLIVLLTDNSEIAIENAKFEFFYKGESSEKHFASINNKSDRFDKENKVYRFSHGLCSGHKDVFLRVSADGFELLEQKIDLPLTSAKHPQEFRIRLARKGTDEKSSFTEIKDKKEK